jgi:hypothetical protein
LARRPLNLTVATARAIASLTGPARTIVGASIRDRDITGPDDIEPGTVANGAGLSRTVSANPIGDISLAAPIRSFCRCSGGSREVLVLSQRKTHGADLRTGASAIQPYSGLAITSSDFRALARHFTSLSTTFAVRPAGMLGRPGQASSESKDEVRDTTS